MSIGTRRIGPWGTAARAVVGVAMIVGATFVGVQILDLVLGLVVFPLVVAAVIAVRGRDATPVRLTGPEGCCITLAVGVAALIVVPAAALLFYGSSMLVAAARGDAGCELFAASNLVWRRDDQIACPLFTPVDRIEHRATVATGSG